MKIALIQLEISNKESRAERLNRVEGLLGRLAAGSEKPDLVMLPEIWGTGFFNFDRYIAESEPLRGETYTRLAAWAEKISCYLLAGSIVEKDESSYYNTSLLIGPDGSLTASYRKVHLFGYRSQESAILTPGCRVITVKTPLGAWGFTTCYDLRFPELYRAMVDEGAEVFLVVAAWPLARLEHWELLNRTRALENLTYLISCNCAGSLQGTELGGGSMVVSPWGEVLVKGGLEEEVIYAELDLSRVGQIREEFPALHDRKLIYHRQ